MKTMRRWVPGPARGASAPVPLKLETVPGRDLAFCTEFAAHGGLARSSRGFKAETELTRMQQAGLLVLQREHAPPFAVVQVALSPAMRALLSGAPAADSSGPAAWAAVDHGTAATKKDHYRKGFEVARGMISAAIKTEFRKSKDQAHLELAAELEERIMTRIGTLQIPLET